MNKQLTLCYCLSDVWNKRPIEVTTVAYISNTLSLWARDQELVPAAAESERCDWPEALRRDRQISFALRVREAKGNEA